MEPMLNTHRLHLLAELACRGTIAAVAEALHYTPSTVSQQLATLEREVGVALVERTARSVRLTPAGVTLAEHARRILDDLQGAEADVRAVGALDRGGLRLATFSSAGAAFVPALLAALSRAHPGTEVAVVEAEPPDAVPLVRHGEVDVALVYDEYPYSRLADEAVEVVPLMADPIVACVPAGHRAVGAGSVALADLRHETFVAGPSGTACHAFLRTVCHEAGFEPTVGYESADMAFTATLVEAGSGVALMPELLVRSAATAVATLPMDPALPPRAVSAVHRRSAGHLPPVRSVLAALAEVIAGQANEPVDRASSS